MGVFSNNRTTLGCDIDIPVAEGYNTPVAADIMLVEAVQTDMSLFEAMISNDFAEVSALKEGTVLESEMQAITEGALHNMVAKVKELLKKIVAKLKALFASFMAKFNSVVIRDNKKFADSVKKEIFSGKDYSKMEYKWSQPVDGKIKEIAENAHKMLDSDNEVDGLGEEAIKSKISEFEGGVVMSGYLFEILGKSKGDTVSAAEFYEKIKEACFNKEETRTGAKDDIKKAYDFLVANPKPVKDLADANKKWEGEFKNKLKKWEKKEKEVKGKEGSEKEDERIEYLKASCLAKMYNGMYTAVVYTHKALVATLKFEIKQYRQLLVKAVAYKPEAPVKENAMLMNEAAESEDFEFEKEFELEDEE